MGLLIRDYTYGIQLVMSNSNFPSNSYSSFLLLIHHIIYLIDSDYYNGIYYYNMERKSANDKIMIAMSGGVDSSVAAYLCIEKMKMAGNSAQVREPAVSGATMKLLPDYDTDDARKVAESLNMPFYVFDHVDGFRECVIESFIDSYKKGETPNPCVECNKKMKFGSFYEKMQELGYNTLATGHYARVEYDDKHERYVLKKALDISKDQSYVLYSLPQEILKNTYLPLGELTKAEVRRIAEEQGFENAHKKESQDICFVPDGDYSTYIEQYTHENFPEGDFVDLDGNVLGSHKGIIRYTIGQRKGLGLALPEPMYVCEKDVIKNKVVLCRNDQLFGDTLIAKDINLITVDNISEPLRVKAKIRYSQTEQPATVTQPDPDTLKIIFDEPQRAIAKGQSVVMYDGDVVVGGGIITGE